MRLLYCTTLTPLNVCSQGGCKSVLCRVGYRIASTAPGWKRFLTKPQRQVILPTKHKPQSMVKDTNQLRSHYGLLQHLQSTFLKHTGNHLIIFNSLTNARPLDGSSTEAETCFSFYGIIQGNHHSFTDAHGGRCIGNFKRRGRIQEKEKAA